MPVTSKTQLKPLEDGGAIKEQKIIVYDEKSNDFFGLLNLTAFKILGVLLAVLMSIILLAVVFKTIIIGIRTYKGLSKVEDKSVIGYLKYFNKKLFTLAKAIKNCFIFKM